MILAIPAEVSCSQGSLTLSYSESSKRLHKGQCQTRLRFLCREHPYKVTTWYRQSTELSRSQGSRRRTPPARQPRQRQYPSSLRGWWIKKSAVYINYCQYQLLSPHHWFSAIDYKKDTTGMNSLSTLIQTKIQVSPVVFILLCILLQALLLWDGVYARCVYERYPQIISI